MSLSIKIQARVFKEIVDSIELTYNFSDSIFLRALRLRKKGKKGAKLTVSETEKSLNVDEEQFKDMYYPGNYKITNNNMSLIVMPKEIKDCFHSQFVVDVYLVKTKQFLSLKRDIANPFMIRDTDSNPIHFSATGSYCDCEQKNPIVVISKSPKAQGDFKADSITEQIRCFVITKFSNYLAKTRIANLDPAVNLNEFSEELTTSIKEEFSENGITVSKISVESISMNDILYVEHSKCSRIGVVGNMTTYSQIHFVDPYKVEEKN